MSRFHKFRDGCSWHLGFYPDSKDSRWQLSIQYIYRYALNFDFGAKWLGDYRVAYHWPESRGWPPGGRAFGPLHFYGSRWPDDE